MKPCGFVGTPNLSIVPEGTVMEIWTAHNVTSQGGILVFGGLGAKMLHKECYVDSIRICVLDFIFSLYFQFVPELTIFKTHTFFELTVNFFNVVGH